MAITPLFGAGDCTTTTSNNNVTRTAVKPANTSDGDLLVAYVYSQFTGGTVTASPAGWTLAKGLGTRTGGLYYRAVPSAAAETATDYTWTVSGYGRMVIVLFRVTGANLSQPFDASGSEAAQTPNGTFNAPSMTVGNGHLLLSLLYWNNSTATTSTVTPDAALTEGIQSSTPTTGNTSGVDVSWQRVSASGASGTRSMTVTPAAASSSVFLATLNEGGFTSLSGDGNLTASGVASQSIGLLLSGSGSLSAAGNPGASQTVSLNGYGQLRRGHAPGIMDTILSNTPIYVAHRGGSVSWPYEETLQAYTYAAAWASPSVLAFEVSVWRSSDGVWVASHDQTTGRVFSGASLDIPTTPWSTLSTLTTINGGYPIARLDTLLDAFPDRAWFVDNKGAQSMSTFLSFLDGRGGPGRFVVKSFGGSTSYAAAARASGYTTWGYYYTTDGSTLTSTQNSWDILGEEYGASAAAWAQVKSYGKPVLAHILPNAAAKATADTYSPNGYMVSGVQAIVPQTPQQALLSGTGILIGSGIAPDVVTIKHFEAGSWVVRSAAPKVYVGGQWVTKIPKRWSGTGWTNL